jgi:Ulp1 family protease
LGDANNGHYVAFVRTPSAAVWAKISDSLVSTISQQQCMAETKTTGFIFLFQKCEISVEKFNLKIRPSDLVRMQPTQWLNDEVKLSLLTHRL